MAPEAKSVLVERIKLTFALFEAGEAMMRERIRREHPDLDERGVEERIVAWLEERPGAEHGDAVGPPGNRDFQGK